jgi:hypothetical protein
VNAYRLHSEPPGLEREILWREIMAQAQEIGSRVERSNEEDIDVLVAEAFEAVRGRRG